MESPASPPADRCSVLARAEQEPLAGTAPVARRWACLEQPLAWPQDIARHRDPLVARFVARATAAGFRVVMIRRPGRWTSGPKRRLYLTDTAPPGAHTTMLDVERPGALAALPLPRPGEPLPGDPVPDPLLLVCTHGRRDRCCALDGRTLVRALVEAGEPDVWESSHLGGHRFAPTALVLPTGYLYGRLDVATAVAARKAAGLGEVETTLCRGRSTWAPEGQVAELTVRAATGLRCADRLSVEGTTVRTTSGGAWRVGVREDVIGPRPASCGVAALPSVVLRAASITPVPPALTSSAPAERHPADAFGISTPERASTTR